MIIIAVNSKIRFEELNKFLFKILKKECFTKRKKHRKKNLFGIGFIPFIYAKILKKGGMRVKKIDFDNINDEIVYETFSVDGNEAEALNDIYLELYELLGKEAMLKVFKHYRGDKIDCPMRLYRPEYIADIAKLETSRRERAKIARAGGYSAKTIETLLDKRRKENENE